MSGICWEETWSELPSQTILAETGDSALEENHRGKGILVSGHQHIPKKLD